MLAFLALVALLALSSRKSAAPSGADRKDASPDGCGLEERGEAGGLVYRSYEPPQFGRVPVVLLHGRGGTEDAMFRKLADVRIPARQLYPRGPVPMGRNWRWARPRSTSPHWASEQAQAVRDLRPFIEWVAECFGPPLLVGHSQGAHMAYGAAVAFPELLSGVIGTSGALTPELWRRPGVPVLAIHGIDDETVPIANARQMADELGVELVEVPGVGHSFDGLRAEVVSALDHMLD